MHLNEFIYIYEKKWFKYENGSEHIMYFNTPFTSKPDYEQKFRCQQISSSFLMPEHYAHALPCDKGQ